MFGMMSAVCNVESLLLHKRLASLQAKRRNQLLCVKNFAALQDKEWQLTGIPGLCSAL